MSNKYNYFAIPSDKIPQPPPYQAVWYASWSPVRPIMGTNSQVGNAAQPQPPLVIGATMGDLPAKATLIGKGRRNRSAAPPPPPFPLPETATTAGYFSSVQRWLTSGTDSQVCSYFSIPFADVPLQPPYVAWYATWSISRPVVEEGGLPSLVIGAISGAVPEGGTFIIALDKDPPPPPPPLSALDMDLASYDLLLTDLDASSPS